MSLLPLALKGVRYYFRSQLLLAFAAALAAAILTGPWIVRSSLQRSLAERAARQRGGVETLVLAGTPFSAASAKNLPGGSAGVIVSRVTVESDSDTPPVSGVTLWGVDDWFWVTADVRPKRGAVMSYRLAMELRASALSTLRIRLEKPSSVPRASALGRRGADDASQTSRSPVQEILPHDHPGQDLSLQPSGAPPLNLFVPLAWLQAELGVGDKVNAVLSKGPDAGALQKALLGNLTLADWGLSVREAGKSTGAPYWAVESSSSVLDGPAERAALAAAKASGLSASPVMVYLANRLQVGNRAAPSSTVSGAALGTSMRLGELPYAVVAAVEPGLGRPLGPILPSGFDEGIDVLLLDLPTGRPMTARNSSITIHYYKPEMEGRLEEAAFSCQLFDRVPLAGPAKNPDLTPNFPGVTDKARVGDWDPPFPYDPSIVTGYEEKFWNQHKATPKAFISLALGKKLFGSRFGSATSVRVAAPNPGDAAALEAFKGQLFDQLRAEPGRFTAEAIGREQEAASGGATDFGLLLAGFSFFLILSGVMLLRLLYRLHVERRAREWGLLGALGFSKSAVRRLIVVEGMAVALVGTLFGLVLAYGYAAGLAKLFAALWPGDWLGGALRVSAPPYAFAAGAGLTLLAAYWSIRSANKALAKLSAIDQIRNQTPETVGGRAEKPGGRAKWAARLALLGGLVLVPVSLKLPPGEARAGGFFGGGFLLLLGMLGLYWVRLRGNTNPVAGLGDLAGRNTSLRPSRSLLTAGVLAAAVFLLVAVESFRRSPAADFDKVSGGSGGYRLAVNTDLPLFQDPADEGRADLEAELQRLDQRQGVTRWRDEGEAVFDKVTMSACAVRPGDDASCLNLYQATKPRVVGVPESLTERNGFQFGGLVKNDADAVQKNPWAWLDQTQADGTIPTFVEQNTAQWQLKKGLGDVLEMPGDAGEPLRFRIVGLLKDSLFQSDLVVGMAAFRRAFPKREGYSLVLVDCPPELEEQARAVLPRAFARQGAAVTRTRDGVALALEVQNTYLTIFQLLGGFGVLLGMGGLAVVLLRNLEERRREFALLRSLGYRAADVARVTWLEYGRLILTGLVIGLVAAFVSVAPHVLAEGSLPVGRLMVIIVLILGAALLVVRWAMGRQLRGDVLTGLRRE